MNICQKMAQCLFHPNSRLLPQEAVESVWMAGGCRGLGLEEMPAPRASPPGAAPAAAAPQRGAADAARQGLLAAAASAHSLPLSLGFS